MNIVRYMVFFVLGLLLGNCLRRWWRGCLAELGGGNGVGVAPPQRMNRSASHSTKALKSKAEPT